jgi:hypothetical protein
MKSKLTLKERTLLDKVRSINLFKLHCLRNTYFLFQEELRPLKAIVLPRTTITRIDGTSKVRTGGEVYGPEYRGGLDSIVSKSISNTGALLYTVKWNDGRTTKVNQFATFFILFTNSSFFFRLLQTHYAPTTILLLKILNMRNSKTMIATRWSRQSKQKTCLNPALTVGQDQKPR